MCGGGTGLIVRLVLGVSASVSVSLTCKHQAEILPIKVLTASQVSAAQSLDLLPLDSAEQLLSVPQSEYGSHHVSYL